MSDSIGLSLQKWFLRNNINSIDHPLFVDATDLAFENFARLIESGMVSQPRRETFGAACIQALGHGGREEADLAKELMSRLAHELSN